MRPKPKFRATVSWILYDFANTAYSMNVVSLYFVTWIIIDLGQNDFFVSLANSLSMILVALFMPVLGDWSDWRGKKLSPLFGFTVVCILGTLSLGILGRSIDQPALLLPLVFFVFVVANFAYQGGLVFYNALLPVVSTPRTLGRVSGYGVALGYLGAIIGLMVAGIFVDGSFFAIEVPFVDAGGTISAFIPTAILFALFAIPIFIFVKEPAVESRAPQGWSIIKSYKKIIHTLRDTQKYPGLARFLIAKFFYEDSIQTVIIYMGVYTQTVMGFSLAEAKLFFVVVIPSAVVGSAVCGILTDHYGPKRTLIAVIAFWVLCLMVVVLNSSSLVFWILGTIIGALLGSTWTAARPLLVSLVPQEMLGEFFGLYALSGKVAAILGPLVWSSVTFLLIEFTIVIRYRVAIAVLAVLMLIGLLILRGVPDYHSRYKFSQKQDHRV
ncbi:MFS transporter [candidate division KSB1 bacterium]|nr:MFS transporter [candidate division KSB1 bacterium]